MDGTAGHSVVEEEQAPAREERHTHGQLKLKRSRFFKSRIIAFQLQFSDTTTLIPTQMSSDAEFGPSCQNDRAATCP